MTISSQRRARCGSPGDPQVWYNRRMILTMPYYDPQGIHNRVFRRQLDMLQSLFNHIFIAEIWPTARDNTAFLAYLADRGCHVSAGAPSAPFGLPALEALRRACEDEASSEPIFYGFLDRLLFSLESPWRQELLSDVSRHAAAACVVFQRSAAAWATHPDNYRESEQMVSRMLQWLCGRAIELSPGAFIFSRQTAQTLAGQSTCRTPAIWGEWVLLALKNGIPIDTPAVDWLAWEDPFWEQADPAQLKRAREGSRDETIKRIQWNAPLMAMLAEERFGDLPWQPAGILPAEAG